VRNPSQSRDYDRSPVADRGHAAAEIPRAAPRGGPYYPPNTHQVQSGADRSL
jgi:hypothetical protein